MKNDCLPHRSNNTTVRYGNTRDDACSSFPVKQKSSILPCVDKEKHHFERNMGSSLNKIYSRGNPPVDRTTTSSSHSVSARNKRDEFENLSSSDYSTFKDTGTSSHFRRYSSDSGYNSSGKVVSESYGVKNLVVNLKLCSKHDKSSGTRQHRRDTGLENGTFQNHHLVNSRNQNNLYDTDSSILILKSHSARGRESVNTKKLARPSLVEVDNTKLRTTHVSQSMLPRLCKSECNGLIGLQNLGNTCFMNSILQCLSNCQPLRDKMLTRDSLQHNRQSKMKGKLLGAFADLIKAMWSKKKSDVAVSPQSFKVQIQRFSPRFVGYEQQDSQEFLRFLLEGLNEDLNGAVNNGRRSIARTSPDLSKLSEKDLSEYMWQQYKTRDDSLVTDLFCGQIMSTLTCTKCSHCSVTFDPFWDLSLPIPRHSYSGGRFTSSSVTLADCLTLFTKKEDLDGDEKPKCEKCKSRQKCQKQIKIHRFPRILVLHLKRFSGFGYRSKLQTDVEFPLTHLDMSPFASHCSDSPYVKYNLFAVSNHSGSAFGGHYTAYCKHPESKEWHSFNDSRVAQLCPSIVRGSQAYVLFYERNDV